MILKHPVDSFSQLITKQQNVGFGQSADNNFNDALMIFPLFDRDENIVWKR